MKKSKARLDGENYQELVIDLDKICGYYYEPNLKKITLLSLTGHRLELSSDMETRWLDGNWKVFIQQVRDYFCEDNELPRLAPAPVPNLDDE